MCEHRRLITHYTVKHLIIFNHFPKHEADESMKIIEESSHMITVPVRDNETEDERRLILNAQQVRRGLNNLKFSFNS